MNKIDFKKSIKKIKDIVANIGSDSDTDWKIIFLLFLFSLLFTVIFHANLFFVVGNPSQSDTPGLGSEGQTVDAKALEATLVSYDKRAEEYQKIASTTFTFVDPAR